MPDLGKMARVWEGRDKRKISLTNVVRRMVMKIAAMIKHPRSEWVNRIAVLLGEPGIGKSTVLRKMVDHLALKTGEVWRAHLLHVGSRGMEDNTGLPVIEEHNGKKVAGWASPKQIPGAVHWLDDDGNPKGYTLGILDELPSAQPSVQDQIREMIDGTIPGSGDPVDPRCVYIAAGNPPEAKHVTANLIDDAIEKRFKVYAVVPTTEELLQVWSDPTIMPDMLYKFLSMNTAAIQHLSPREWEGVGKDAQYMLEAGGSHNDALVEIEDELHEYPDVTTVLRQFFEHGDDPFYYPIRGTKILSATKANMANYMELMRRWIADGGKDALLGETSNDLQRVMRNTPSSELADIKTASDNLYQLMNFLAGQKYPDMVKAIMGAVCSTPLVGKVSTKMRKSENLMNMNLSLEKAQQFAEQIGATASR